MTTVYSAAQDIADACVETLTFRLSQDQISSVFDLSELISEETGTFVTGLFATHDIFSLYADLGYPEPEQMGDTIGSSVDMAIRFELAQDERLIECATLSINTWAADEMYERKFDLDDYDLSDTQELVRALA